MSDNTPIRALQMVELPVAAATRLVAGRLGALNAAGYLVHAADAPGLRVVGRIDQDVDNLAGEAGARTAVVRRQPMRLGNDTVNPVTTANVGQPVYVLASTIVSASGGTNGIVAGRCLVVDADGVWIDPGAGADSLPATTSALAGQPLVLAPGGRPVWGSAPAAITSPRDIPELDAALFLWLDASDVPYSAADYTAKSTDGGAVAVWPDKSGNSNHATSGTNKPVFRATGFNGLPCVEFTRASSHYLDTANALPAGVDTSGMSFYVVCDTSIAVNSACVPLSVFGGTTNCYLNVQVASGIQQFNGSVSGTGARANGYMDTTNPQGVYSLIRDAVNNVIIEGFGDIWRQDQMYGTLHSGAFNRRYATTGTTNLVGGKVRIGATATPDNHWPGKICEVLVFTSPLTDEQDRLIRDYLAAKWGLCTRHLVLCCGNSITTGYGATTGNSQYLLPPGMASITGQTTGDNYPNYLWQALGAGYSVRVDSYSGRRLDAMLPESRKFAPTFVLPSTGRKHVAIVLEGTNEIQQKRTLGYEMFARYCQERRNEGFKVIAATVLKASASGRPTFEADRQVYNGRVRANWNRFADALADLGNEALYPELNDPTNAAYANNSGDGLHPNSAGYLRMAQVLAPMVQALVA